MINRFVKILKFIKPHIISVTVTIAFVLLINYLVLTHVKVSGISMNPTFNDGHNLIMYKLTINPKLNDIVVCKDSDINSGYIINVASSAGFMAGPKLATYYATKNYVLKLTLAIYEELKKKNSKVHISALCPGPVDTNFNDVANGTFATKSLTSDFVADYTIHMMFKNKLVIIPGTMMKIVIFLTRLTPTKLLLKFTYKIQDRKTR